MIDRTELDVRFAEHRRRTRATGGHTPPPTRGPGPSFRLWSAKVLRALAMRLDPATSPPMPKTSPPATAAS